MMKQLKLIVALVAGIVLLGSCLKDSDPQPQLVGGTTFVNAFIEADAVFCYIDRNTIPALNPLPYRSFGPNPPVYAYPGEGRRVEIYSTYDDNRLVDTAVTVQDSVFIRLSYMAHMTIRYTSSPRTGYRQAQTTRRPLRRSGSITWRIPIVA